MCSLKIIRYVARVMDLNEYLDYCPGSTLYDTIGPCYPKNTILNSMPNIWSNQAYVQGFDCEYISFMKSVNMFEKTEIAEAIYKGVVEPSYKIYTISYSNCAVNIRYKRGDNTLIYSIYPLNTLIS